MQLLRNCWKFLIVLYYMALQNKIVQACLSSCQTCQASTPYGCASCNSVTQFRQISGTSCPCMVGYYDNSVNVVCQACYYACQTCVYSGSSSCQTCDTDRTLSVSQCLCPAPYSDLGVHNCVKTICTSNKCTQCYQNQSCYSCAADRTNPYLCTTCPTGKYDDNINPSCQNCSARCLNCSNTNNNCTVCQVGRVSPPGCPCQSGYYEIPSTYSCSACSFKCLTCNTSSSNCTQCQPTRMTIPNCDCIPGTYEDSLTFQCLACQPQCITCSGLNSNCTQCQPGRVSTPSCACPSGYYQDSSTYQCDACYAGCVTCSGSSTNCSQCQISRVSTPNCYCPSNTYENSSNFQCSACQSQCNTCVGTGSNCSTCQSATAATPSCFCPTSQYQDPLTLQCNPCYAGCIRCSLSSTNCTQCQPSRVFTPSCSCPTGAYENSSTYQCIQCQPQCMTCLGSSSNCTQCQTGRVSTPQCDCPIGQYQDTSTYTCNACYAGCLTCSLGSTNCTQCQPSRLSTPNCGCPSGSYENILTYQCTQCQPQCITCLGSSSNCTQCQTGRVSKPQCDCPIGQYQDTSTYTCNACYAGCLTCSLGSTNCTQCQPSRLSTPNCGCPSGSYENILTYQCTQCQPQCITCLGSSSNCSQCQAGRSSKPQCDCPIGYYQDPLNFTCNACYVGCLTCSNQSTNCEQCQPSRISPPNCGCPTGTYENTSSQQCLACQTQCITCTGSSSNCTSCQPTRGSIPQCDCTDGQYQDVLTYQCKTCISRCLTCTSYSNCTSCQLDRIQDSPQCECQVGYYEDTSNYTCYACSLKCLSCEVGSHNCTSCAVMRSQQPQCDCQDGYYESLISYTCQKCNQMCSKCSKYANNCIYPQCYSQFCLTCQSNSIILCEICQDSYYVSTAGICLPCGNSCENCITYGHCQKCLQNSITTQDGSSITCTPCDAFQGLYYDPQSLNCKPICGDGIRVQDEQCDDGNLVNGDGCSSLCQIENLITGCDYTKYSVKICTKKKIFVLFNYADPKTTTSLLVIFQTTSLTTLFCNYTSFFMTKQQNFFASQVQSTQMVDQIDCLYQISGDVSISNGELIWVNISDTQIHYQQNYIFVVLNESIQTREIILLTLQDKEQAVLAESTSQGTNTFLLIMYLFAIFLGGFKFLWKSLEIYAWIETLYFVNVRYPANVESFFKLISWAEIFFVAKPFNLNTEHDVYYQPTPAKFLEKGKNTCFIQTTIVNIIVICLLIAAYPICLTLQGILMRALSTPPKQRKSIIPSPNVQKRYSIQMTQALYAQKKKWNFHPLEKSNTKSVSPVGKSKFYYLQPQAIQASSQQIIDFRKMELKIQLNHLDSQIQPVELNNEKAISITQIQTPKQLCDASFNQSINQQLESENREAPSSKQKIIDFRKMELKIQLNHLDSQIQPVELNIDKAISITQIQTPKQLCDASFNQSINQQLESEDRETPSQLNDSQCKSPLNRLINMSMETKEILGIKCRVEKSFSYSNSDYSPKPIAQIQKIDSHPVVEKLDSIPDLEIVQEQKSILIQNSKSHNLITKKDTEQEEQFQYVTDCLDEKQLQNLEVSEQQGEKDQNKQEWDNQFIYSRDKYRDHSRFYGSKFTQDYIQQLEARGEQFQLPKSYKLIDLFSEVSAYLRDQSKSNGLSVLVQSEVIEKNLNFTKRLVKILYKACTQFTESFIGIILQTIMLCFLDLEMASLLQLRQPEVARHPIIAINVILALLFQIFSFGFFALIYQKVNRSDCLLEYYPYESQYGVLYKDIDTKKTQVLFFSIFSLLKKKLFMDSLVLLFDYPFLQTTFCTLSTLISLMLIGYQNPFNSIYKTGMHLVGELGIFICLACTIIFAFNDQIKVFSDEQELSIGWFIIALICFIIAFQCTELFKTLFSAFKQRYEIIMWVLFNRKLPQKHTKHQNLKGEHIQHAQTQ